MEELRTLVGHERPLREIAQALYFSSSAMAAPAAGALHVTCSDESENECAEALQRGFVLYMLPKLKFARQSAFRLANLGGRYEWSAVRLAEAHYASPETDKSFKLLVVKINAHVAYEELSDAAFRLGSFKRYGRESKCCGALHMLLQGDRQPYIDDLAESFESEGHDRVAALRDASRVEQRYAPLYAAIVSARLQARKALLDIQDYSPLSPTYYVVLPCVTINRPERDTEIVCGIYEVDGRSGSSEAVYFGLEDRPEDYTTSVRNGRFLVTDAQFGKQRKGRDHRTLVRAALREHAVGGRTKIRDERLERVLTDVARRKHRQPQHARKLLRIVLPVLSEVAPIPAAILAFADGAAGIQHAFKVHKLAQELRGTAEARRILDEIEGRIDQLDNERAEALLELLLAEYR